MAIEKCVYNESLKHMSIILQA